MSFTVLKWPEWILVILIYVNLFADKKYWSVDIITVARTPTVFCKTLDLVSICDFSFESYLVFRFLKRV